MATDFRPAKAAYARSRPTGAITLCAYRHPTRNPRASAAAIRPITPSDNPKAENRSGSRVPRKPEPSMISAVLIRGGATRHGMAAGRAMEVAGAEVMQDFIAALASRRGRRPVRLVQ